MTWSFRALSLSYLMCSWQTTAQSTLMLALLYPRNALHIAPLFVQCASTKTLPRVPCCKETWLAFLDFSCLISLTACLPFPSTILQYYYIFTTIFNPFYLYSISTICYLVHSSYILSLTWTTWKMKKHGESMRKHWLPHWLWDSAS